MIAKRNRDSGAAEKNTSQTAKFKEAARTLGCDEDEAAFEERLKKIAKATPPKPENKKPRRGARG
jgi:hypothetical protein